MASSSGCGTVTPLAIVSWLLHFFMALMAVPLISGHLYMALINPASLKRLHGTISGFVDRHWAKHHYRRWYREHHEASEEEAPAPLASHTPREDPT